MAQGTATSFAVPNFSGMLFAKGQQATPFSTMIGARPLVTNHVEFTCGQEYNTETGEQPNISETWKAEQHGYTAGYQRSRSAGKSYG